MRTTRQPFLTIRRTLLLCLAALFLALAPLNFVTFLSYKEAWTFKELLTPIVRSAMMIVSMAVGWAAGEIVLRLTRRLLVSRLLEVLLIVIVFFATMAAVGWWMERWEKPMVQSLAGEPYIRNRPVSAWVGLTQYPEPSVRLEAIGALEDAHDPAGLPALIRALKDADQGVRLRAARALRGWGPSAAEAVPGLIESLDEQDQSGMMHYPVAEALGNIGPAAGKARSALVRQLSRTDESRNAAALALGQIGPANEVAPILIQTAFRQESPPDSQTVVEALAALGPPVVPLLIPELRSGKDRPRSLALGALGRLKTTGKEAAPALRELLKDSEPLVRVDAASTLWDVTESTDDVLPVLIDNVRCKDNSSCPYRWAAAALAKMGAQARPAVPDLLDRLPSQEGSWGKYTIEALLAIDRDNPAVVAALCKAVTDRNDITKTEAISAVGSIGPPAQAAVPALKDLIRQNDLTIRLSVCAALIAIDPSQNALVLAALRDRPKDPKRDPTRRVIELLAQIGSPEAVALLATFLTDRDHLERQRAAEELRKLGPAAKPAVPQLIEALGDSDRQVIQYAAEALGAIGPDAHDAVPKLIECGKEDYLDHGKACKNALAEIAPRTYWWLRWRGWLIAAGILLFVSIVLEWRARWARRQEARRVRPAPPPNPFDNEGRIASP